MIETKYKEMIEKVILEVSDYDIEEIVIFIHKAQKEQESFQDMQSKLWWDVIISTASKILFRNLENVSIERFLSKAPNTNLN